jgi:alpha-1,3-rhamnosyl/mannosyltransferase
VNPRANASTPRSDDPRANASTPGSDDPRANASTPGSDPRRPRVLLDARKARDFGIGRTILGLLDALGSESLELTALVRSGDEELLPRHVAPARCDAASYSLWELVAVRRAIARVAPDVFHAPHYVVPLAPPRATVVTIHDLMHLARPEHRSLAKRAYATVMMRRAVASAARVLVPSETTRRELVAFDGRAGAKTRVVPNGVDRLFRTPPPDAERARVKSAYALRDAYVLFTGNDKPHKNLGGLLAAFALLAENGVGLDLVLAGGAASRAKERLSLLETNGLLSRVHDLGVVPDADLAPLIAEARAVVLPSLAEGFGLPVVEAQTLGTPVVCSDRGALPEVANGAALLVDPTDAGALAEAMRRAATDEALRRALVEKGRANAARFTWAEAAARTAAVYREVVEAR